MTKCAGCGNDIGGTTADPVISMAMLGNGMWHQQCADRAVIALASHKVRPPRRAVRRTIETAGPTLMEQLRNPAPKVDPNETLAERLARIARG